MTISSAERHVDMTISSAERHIDMTISSAERHIDMTISSAEPGENQSPKNTISEQIVHSRTQHIVSRYNEKLRHLDRKFVLCAFESGLISGENAESWLTEIEAGRRPKGAIKSLIIDHYAHGKLSADKVAELFQRLDLGRG